MTRRILSLTTLLTAFSLTGFTVAQVEDAPRHLEPGVTFHVYDIGRGIASLSPLAEDQTPNVDEKRNLIDFPAQGGFGGLADYFFVEVGGWIQIDDEGRYEFELVSDDGSVLKIDNREIIRHDGLHAASAKRGSVLLEQGLHRYDIAMFENAGGEALTLSWKKPDDSDFQIVPASVFFVEKGITRVVSPGLKILLDGREHLKPGDGLPLQSVHPSWVLEAIRPDGFEPQVGGMDFLPDGRLIVSSFEPVNNGVFREDHNGAVWALSNVLEATSPSDVSVEQIAGDFHDPLGVLCHDGDLYVLDRNAITLLADRDNDGRFEHREIFASGWTSDNYHHFSFGLIEHEGYLYGALSTSIYFDNTMKADGVVGNVISMNGPNPKHRGSCFRVSLETREIEYLAGGFRTPNGIGIGPDGEIFVADNQGAWLPASKLVHVRQGAFYGHANGLQTSERYPDGGNPSLNHDAPVSPPAVWMPQNECANSPSQMLFLSEGEFAGQFLQAEITTGGIRRIALEKVNGCYQGAVFRFCQGFECGLNRLVFGPDGCLYVGGTGAGGNWSWRNKRFGLQRLRPTTQSAFEMHSIIATASGFEIRFTRPVPRLWLEDPENYQLHRWHYVPTPQYGGPKHDEHELLVTGAAASNDLQSVRIDVAGLTTGSVIHLRVDPTSVNGDEMWSKEAWYTLNEIPRASALAKTDVDLIDHERPLKNFRADYGDWAANANVQMDASDSRKLRGVSAISGEPTELLNGSSGRTAHLVSALEHGDIEAHIEFMVPEGSNSGIYFMGRYEIQVLDSYGKTEPAHSDCGGIYQRWDPSRESSGYEGVPPRVNAALPAGKWQSFDVVFLAPRFDENGAKIRNARFVRVTHNGAVIHENIELSGPTRAAMLADESPRGPLMFQGDHGPVAYRNLRLRSLDGSQLAPAN